MNTGNTDQASAPQEVEQTQELLTTQRELPPPLPPIEDFISFKFFLHRFKGVALVVKEEVRAHSGEVLREKPQHGILSNVTPKYFEVQREEMTSSIIEFGRDSDWTFSVTDNRLSANRRNGGVLTLIFELKK